MWSTSSSLLLTTSSSSSSHFNVLATDANTGTVVSTFKGNTSGVHTLNILKQTYLLSSQPNKCILNVWSLRRHEQLSHPKLVLPNVPRCLAVSHCGNFLAASSASNLSLWQICNGVLHCVLQGAHVQSITQLKFAPDQHNLVSAGEDGRVVQWWWPECVSSGCSSSHRGCQSAHSLNVTAMRVTLQRVYTASLDKSCKIHSLASMQLLLDIRFDDPLTALCVDPTESQLYVGTANGQVMSFSLCMHYPKVSSVGDMQQLRSFAKKTTTTSSISCLDVTTDNRLLASANVSSNEVSVYDTHSGQCLRTLDQKSVPNDVLFVSDAVHEAILNKDNRDDDLVLKPLSRVVKDERKPLEVCFTVNDDEAFEQEDDHFHDLLDSEDIKPKMRTMANHSDEEMDSDMNRLKSINQQLYHFALNKLLKETPNGAS